MRINRKRLEESMEALGRIGATAKGGLNRVALTDDDLFQIAWQRKGSLRAALAERAAADGRLRDALWRLEQCERRFASETPFAFYAWLLGGDGGRARVAMAGRPS